GRRFHDARRRDLHAANLAHATVCVLRTRWGQTPRSITSGVRPQQRRADRFGWICNDEMDRLEMNPRCFAELRVWSWFRSTKWFRSARTERVKFTVGWYTASKGTIRL